jgi:hypothetical protein
VVLNIPVPYVGELSCLVDIPLKFVACGISYTIVSQCVIILIARVKTCSSMENLTFKTANLHSLYNEFPISHGYFPRLLSVPVLFCSCVAAWMCFKLGLTMNSILNRVWIEEVLYNLCMFTTRSL